MIGLILPLALAERVRRAAADRVPLKPITEHALSRSLRRSQLVGLVVDPWLLASWQLSWAERQALLDRTLPTIFYTALTPAAAQALLSWSELRPSALLLSDHEDSPERLFESLQKIRMRTLGRQFLDLLGVNRERTPARVMRILDRIANHPEAVLDASHLARDIGISRRTLDRLLVASGLGPARRLLVASKVWQSIHLICRQELRVREVTARLGYADRVSLGRHIHEVLGVHPSDLRSGLNSAHVRTSILHFVRPDERAHVPPALTA